MFNIHDGAGYSLAQIRKFLREEGSVLRSAHVGNFNPATLFLAQEEFPVILHEHILGRAKIYEPMMLKVAGNKILLSNGADLPITHDVNLDMNILRKSELDLQSVIGDDFLMRPAQVHWKSLKFLFPETVSLASQLLMQQEPFIASVIEVLALITPEEFTNYVTREGRIFNLLTREDDVYNIYQSGGEEVAIRKSDIGGLATEYLKQTIEAIDSHGLNPEGLVMKSNLYILLSTVAEVYRGRNGVQRYYPEGVSVIHFAGAEMMNYLLKNDSQALQNQSTLEFLYENLYAKFADRLPREVNFHLVSTDMIGRLVSTDADLIAREENLLVGQLRLVEEVREKWQKKEVSIGELKDELLKLEDGQLVERVIGLQGYKDQLSDRTTRKRLDKTVELLTDVAANRGKIIGNLICLEMAKSSLLQRDEGIASVQREIGLLRTAIVDLAREVDGVPREEITQYDLIQREVRLCYPEIGWQLSQEKLRGVYYEAVRGVTKETEGKRMMERLT